MKLGGREWGWILLLIAIDFGNDRHDGSRMVPPVILLFLDHPNQFTQCEGTRIYVEDSCKTVAEAPDFPLVSRSMSASARLVAVSSICFNLLIISVRSLPF